MQSARHAITVVLILVLGSIEAFLLLAGQTHG